MPKIIDTKEMRERLGVMRDELATLAAIESPNDEQIEEFDTLEAQAKAKRVQIKRTETSNEFIAEVSSTDPATSGLGREDRTSKPDTVEPEPAKRTIEIPDRALPITRMSYYRRDNRERLEAGYAAGQWVLATLFRADRLRGVAARATQWCSDHGIETRVMQGADNSLGGALVPQEFMAAIIDLREQYAVFRANTRVVPMASDTMLVPRRAGGLTGYYINENTAITASDATFSQVQLTAKTLATLTRMSNAVAEDSVIDLADWIAQEVAWIFSKEEDQAGFIGDGTSTYGGIFGAEVRIDDGNHAASIHTALSGNTAFSSLDLVDFHSLMGILPQFAIPNARWYISRAGFTDSMARLAYAGGGNTVDSISGGQGLMFLGYPVVISQVMNSTLAADTDSIKLLFGDLSRASMMGDRRDMRVFSTEHRYAEFDQTGIIATQRYDIVVHDLGDGTDAGPLVAMKTPSS